jgi:hypothetical protein
VVGVREGTEFCLEVGAAAERGALLAAVVAPTARGDEAAKVMLKTI